MPETAAESALILPNRSQRPVVAERPVLVWLPSARPFLWLAMLGFWHWGMASCRLTHVGEIAERCICRRHERPSLIPAVSYLAEGGRRRR